MEFEFETADISGLVLAHVAVFVFETIPKFGTENSKTYDKGQITITMVAVLPLFNRIINETFQSVKPNLTNYYFTL